MKGKTILMIVLISILSIAFVSFQYGQTSTIRTMSTFFVPSEVPLPPNIDELLKKDYGESKYYDKNETIKISLEKIIDEKYFIEYSWVDGNESYFGVGLLIEHLNKETLKKDDFKSIWIEDNLGNKYMPLPYYEITDFPKDRPLGWKQLFYGKFPSIDKKAKNITIHFKYQEQEFKIKNVPIQ
ncbi:hypothetical protein [Garciella nitratireducens]|uniref:DUF5643 domain-containing protein n=1 Tax=Garciella nitratireducens DSM 15102 TaxID=1121911 RepID=A0A1T4PI97_9FIRM|nr:hypothetical protein [Garciella nitratireducens]RBP37599.1 hypothetical protein DFR81_12310 [Garciella nitratireducens]SJZ91253.1 hypothetical protein SAMN02745973_02103 [Garciella nitratireducens DSM 15102]